MFKKQTAAVPAEGEPPRTALEKLLASTPVTMTIVATLMAGLSNSEMTRAQYNRSLAAQQQSKSGDQWSFFQAMRLRGSQLRANLQLLQATAEVAPLDQDALRQLAVGGGPGTNLTQALQVLAGGPLPVFTPAESAGPKIQAVLAAVGAGQPEEEIAKLMEGVTPAALTTAIRIAQENSRGSERVLAPLTQTVDQLEQNLAAQPLATREAIRPLWRSFISAHFRYDASRYDAESRSNRVLAELYELQVRLSNSTAERHHLRSQRFFFGMLGAQAAVILASFAIAVQRRNLIWGFAALIGLGAVAFGVYVYLWI